MQRFDEKLTFLVVPEYIFMGKNLVKTIIMAGKL